MPPSSFARRLPAPVKDILRPWKNIFFPGRTSSSAPVPHPIDDGSRWFWDHFEYAAKEVIQFLEDGGWAMEGKRVADIGCGEGLTDLGVILKGRPSELIGFDINPTSADRLLARARSEKAVKAFPAGLSFVTSEPTSIPAPDASFDIAFSWSAFEHVQDPPKLLKEIHRILRPDGVFMLQLWPFYHSRFGSHLWEWLPEGFDHLYRDSEEIQKLVTTHPGKSPEWTEIMLAEFNSLNQITLDELQAAIIQAGFTISRFQLMTYESDLPAEVSAEPLSQLGISGVKLLATPR